MDLRQFGNTDLKVSALGFGAGQVGDESLDGKMVETLLNSAVDMGINLFDTARGYGVSEQRIGKYLAHRRQDIVISTKIGYSVPNTQDWTPECITEGIHLALKTLKTDYLDIVHLHSCPTDILQQEEVINALLSAKQQGKIRAAAYAGENDALEYAMESGHFDSLLMSVNICDQRFIHNGLSEAKEKGLGIIAKRPVANAPWRFEQRPEGHYCEVYWERLQKMALSFDLSWQEIAVRFAAYTYGVDSIITGTTNLEHLKQNQALVEKGALPQEVVDTLYSRFTQCDDNWVGQV